jgi:hypothetical protein
MCSNWSADCQISQLTLSLPLQNGFSLKYMLLHCSSSSSSIPFMSTTTHSHADVGTSIPASSFLDTPGTGREIDCLKRFRHTPACRNFLRPPTSDHHLCYTIEYCPCIPHINPLISAFMYPSISVRLYFAAICWSLLPRIDEQHVQSKYLLSPPVKNCFTSESLPLAVM